MGAGPDLGECCGSVENRIGLGGRANWCSDHHLGASSYNVVLGREKSNPTLEKPQYRAGSGAQGQIYLCFIIRHASCDVGVTYVKADGLASINDPQNVILKHVRYCLSSRELPASGTPTSRGVPGSLCSKRNLATPSPSNWQTCKQRKGLAVLPPSCQNQKNGDHRALARLTRIRLS